jgi:hypothetical protein
MRRKSTIAKGKSGELTGKVEVGPLGDASEFA